MRKGTLPRDAYAKIHSQATSGGSKKATNQAEEEYRRGNGMDPNVDPKGPDHLGPIRRSLPRFEKQGNLWLLPNGMPMPEETLLDTTGSMGGNVDLAFEILPESYGMYTTGKSPILGRYDVQIASGIFNDVEDRGLPVLCRTQFEANEKIALQMTKLIPGRGGCANGKEDPQFGLFGAAYLTDASINRYGLRYYHFTISDEPLVPIIDLVWLRKIFGDDVLEHVKANGFDFDAKSLLDTEKVVFDLQKNAHAFFLQVGDRTDVKNQWTGLYGEECVIMLPNGTQYLHYVKAAIIGLTEGVLDLNSAKDFLGQHGASKDVANKVVRAVAHIPLGAQRLCPNYDKIPKAGDFFREKTDLWPIDPGEISQDDLAEGGSGSKPIDWL